jgi:hypothetical protein
MGRGLANNDAGVPENLPKFVWIGTAYRDLLDFAIIRIPLRLPAPQSRRRDLLARLELKQGVHPFMEQDRWVTCSLRPCKP